jgi:deoxyribodipyrimidine photo-lyase
MPDFVDPRRVRVLRSAAAGKGPVVWWLSRDQRMRDNWALLFAQELALAARTPLIAVFCLVPSFLGATLRQYGFMLRGLAETAADLRDRQVPLVLLQGEPGEEVPRFLAAIGAGALVTDFDPLRLKRSWKVAVASRIGIPFYEVDAHNIIPCWLASPKQEWAAYSFRPKVRRALPGFLTDFPEAKKHPHRSSLSGHFPPVDDLLAGLPVDQTVPEVDWLAPGETAAHQRLEQFLTRKLARYEHDRNDPTKDGQSNLSPYLHFGQLSAQRVALAVMQADAPPAAREAFLEELIVRRELSDNYCFYNLHYDGVAGFPEWARRTLKDRRRDVREYAYAREEFEEARTHEALWNAAQTEMVKTGKMHGYLRMYWAKKILEWSPTPEAAWETAVYLNDRYELDGRDPNGYVGIAWSLGGVHDRAWKERPIFGKIRYMSLKGMRAKFAVEEYIRRFRP